MLQLYFFFKNWLMLWVEQLTTGKICQIASYCFSIPLNSGTLIYLNELYYLPFIKSKVQILFLPQHSADVLKYMENNCIHILRVNVSNDYFLLFMWLIFERVLRNYHFSLNHDREVWKTMLVQDMNGCCIQEIIKCNQGCFNFRCIL